MSFRPTRGMLGAFVGLLCAAVALGVGEAVAAYVRPEAAPVIAVGNRVILFTPESTKRSAINSFGTDDKTVLLLFVYVLVAVLAAFIGTLAVRRLRYGLVGLGLLGAFGVYCALTDHASRASDAVPTIVGTIVAGVVMVMLLRTVDDEPEPAAGTAPADRVRLADRRGFLHGSAAAAGLAAVAGFGGRGLQHVRYDVAAARSKVRLPRPVSAAQSSVASADLGKSGVKWDTPNSDFYRIDTALTLPQIEPKTWTLRIHGMVDREIHLNYDQLLARPMIERWITLCCVSNVVGGNLVGNARFLGARLTDLLHEAGVHAGADQLLMTSVDGLTIGSPTAVVMDGRDSLLAVGMNGAPLPIAHGFPVRVVVPGLYGYVSACKWVVDIEATTFDKHRAYWVQGGWKAFPPIKLESRIDTPRTGARVPVGRPVAIAGVAWDQHVGVSKVEVQVEDGEWMPARLASVPSTDTWRQWVVAWTPTKSGSYTVRVRATDASGELQTTDTAPPFPSGATGLHKIIVRAG